MANAHAGIMCATSRVAYLMLLVSSCLLSTMKISAVASGVPRIEQIVWIWSMKSLPLNLNMFGVGRETDRATLFGAERLLLKYLEALFSWNDRSLQWFKD